VASVPLSSARAEVEGLLSRGDAAAALALVQQIAAKFPNDYRTSMLRGRAQLAFGDRQAAAAEFEHASLVVPDDRQPWELLASLGSDGAASVLSDLPPLPAANGDRPPISGIALGHLYLRSASGGLLTHCTSQLGPLWQAQPQRLDVGVALAEAHWRLEEHAAVEQICRQILGAAPHCLKANLLLGQLLWSTGDRSGAAPLLEAAEAADPENAVAEDLFEHLWVRDPDLAPLRRREVTVDIEAPAPVAQAEPIELALDGSEPQPMEVPAAGTEPAPAAAAAVADAAQPVNSEQAAEPEHVAQATESQPLAEEVPPAAEGEPRSELPPAIDIQPATEAPANASLGSQPSEAAPVAGLERQPEEPGSEPEPRPLQVGAAHGTELQPTHEGPALEAELQPLHDENAPEAELQPLHDENAPEAELQPLHDENAPEAELQPLHDENAPETELQPLHDELAPPPELQPQHEEVAPAAELQRGHGDLSSAPEFQPAPEQETASAPEHLLQEPPVLEGTLAKGEPEHPETVLAPAPARQQAEATASEGLGIEPEVAETAPEPALAAIEAEAAASRATSVTILEVAAHGEVRPAKANEAARRDSAGAWYESCRALARTFGLGEARGASMETTLGPIQVEPEGDGLTLAFGRPGTNLGLVRSRLRRHHPPQEHDPQPWNEP